jgi:chromosome segregation ATPase
MIKQHVINTLRSATTVFVAQDKDGGGLALHPSNVLVLIDSLQHQLIQKDREMSHVSERLKFIDDGMDKTVAGFDRVVAQRDDLKKQLAERDRTIARLSADLDTSVSSQIDMTDKAYRYQKALKEAKTAIQKNLAFANGKDEQALLSAFNHINKALGE